MLEVKMELVRKILPNVYHIEEANGVYSTLIVGSERALLIDTGYGVFDLKHFVESVTEKPYDVVNTHGHPDHTLGNGAFSKTWISKVDVPVVEYNCSKKELKVTCDILSEHSGLPKEILSDIMKEKHFKYQWLEPNQVFDLGDT